MQVTIERDENGNSYTTIWHKPKGWAEAADCDVTEFKVAGGVLIGIAKFMGAHIYTKLPPLLKKPGPSGIAVVHRYISEGLTPKGKFFDAGYIFEHEGEQHQHPAKWHENCHAIYDPVTEITHCTDAEGNRVEVAIV